MLDNNDILNSAFALAECKERIEEMERKQSAQRISEYMAANAGLVQQLELQNKTLREQVELLKEENERQKQQLLQSQKNEELARKEAKSSKIFSYISFGVATVLSIIALIVAIIK